MEGPGLRPNREKYGYLSKIKEKISLFVFAHIYVQVRGHHTYFDPFIRLFDHPFLLNFRIVLVQMRHMPAAVRSSHKAAVENEDDMPGALCFRQPDLPSFGARQFKIGRSL